MSVGRGVFSREKPMQVLRLINGFSALILVGPTPRRFKFTLLLIVTSYLHGARARLDSDLSSGGYIFSSKLSV